LDSEPCCPYCFVMATDNKALAKAAKERGNALFSKKTMKDYEQALVAYQEAIEHDPEDHVFYANCSACHIELGNDSYEPKKKVASYASALKAARECTKRGPDWAKGFVRQSAAEFELVAAIAKWEDRKIQDEKWRKEDEERAEKDRKEGREPYLPSRKEDTPLDEELKGIAEGAGYSACEASCRKGLELEPANALLRTRLQALRDTGHSTDEAKDREMRDATVAAEMKAKGNAAFSAKKWKDAIENYTKAMEQDPFDHVFFSNRSACYAESEEFEKALKDANRCVALKPDFAKGYSRQAHAMFHVGQYIDMELAAKKGLELDAASVALQDLLKQAQIETKDSLEVQAQMHKLRNEKRQDAKLQDLMKGLNMGGGNGVQMFTPGAGGDLSGLMAGLNGGGGGGGFGGMPGMGGFGGNGKSRMTEDQMRGMAKAMAAAPNAVPGAAGYNPPAAPAPAASPAPAAAESLKCEGPSSFGPK